MLRGGWLTAAVWSALAAGRLLIGRQLDKLESIYNTVVLVEA